MMNGSDLDYKIVLKEQRLVKKKMIFLKYESDFTLKFEWKIHQQDLEHYKSWLSENLDTT